MDLEKTIERIVQVFTAEEIAALLAIAYADIAWRVRDTKLLHDRYTAVSEGFRALAGEVTK